MHSLNNLIERCHERHEKPLRQRKTVVMPALYNNTGYPYQMTVYCAQRYRVLLADLEQANVSFMPIGHAPDNDHGPGNFGGKRFLSPQKAQDWGIRRWHASWGIQVYTGIPSAHAGAQWHDIEFKYEVISAAPDAVLVCIDALVNAIENPLLTLTKSGGLRFSCRVPDYLHPNTENTKQYIYKHTPTAENPDQRDIYLEVSGKDGYTPWDARYEILFGSLLDPPVVAKEVLFAPIDALRAELHEPMPREVEQDRTVDNVPLSFGSDNLDLAKKAFLNRGFSYVGQENDFHHWRQPDSTIPNEHVLLWEADGTVWVRATASDTGLPTEATSITEIWNNTGILPSTFEPELFVSDRIVAVRAGALSPLTIRRPPPVLHKLKNTEKHYETRKKIQDIFDGTTRILGLATEERLGKNHQIESYISEGGTICLSVPIIELVEKINRRYQEQNMPSSVHWKPRMHLWAQVKEIPFDVRMEDPFQQGNVCEDAERCDALEKKGGNPSESICPQCPVYDACQQRGYLSQPTVLKRAESQILAVPQLFFNPQYAELAETILEQVDETERLCIIGRTREYKLFPKCELPRNLFEEWSVNWSGCALGNFAKALLHAVEIKDIPHAAAVKRIRMVIQSFEWQEETLIRQMGQVNARGKVIERSAVDPETGELLARFTIEFEAGVSAYIPLDDSAADRLTANKFPFFQLSSFTINEDVKILMPMAQATRLGILDTETVESIQEFPTVCPNPNWTYWHQLKHFFTHYTRDADAPIRWDKKNLEFWVPPLLHPKVKRLVLTSPILPDRYLHRAFPDERIEVSRTEPAAWDAGNQVFQIRTGIYPRQTILGYNVSGDVVGISKIGQRFFAGIQSEIERDASVKHAIITYKSVAARLQDITEKENVSFVTSFESERGLWDAFRESQVIWIVGTPTLQPTRVWQRAQILFGNDEEPLSYEEETETGRYKDERVQGIYEQEIIRQLTQTVLRTGLSQWTDRKVILISSLTLPGITDRPETLLFDWEDFEVADGLDKLPEVIATREHFEAARDNLNAESSREEVERVLGCSSRQANRVLRAFRGGAPLRVPFRIQILTLLADGEKKTAELINSIEGHPKAVKNELKRLVDAGEIVRVRWGLYALPRI